MSNPTKQQVIDCNDEQQLNVWAGIYCMGYEMHPRIDCLVKRDKRSGDIASYPQWQPCSPTEKGKAQCLDLMVKYKLSMYLYKQWESYRVVRKADGAIDTESEAIDCSPQIAIVKAAILSELATQEKGE